MTKEKKPMNTALQQYPKGQPPYAQAYPQDHPNADTHIQNMAQIRSIAACVQHSAEHANAKIRQVHEQEETSSSSSSSEEENKDLKVPKFMMRCEEEKLQELLEDILRDHRCMTCQRYLC